jgi:hypothetical protein
LSDQGFEYYFDEDGVPFLIAHIDGDRGQFISWEPLTPDEGKVKTEFLACKIHHESREDGSFEDKKWEIIGEFLAKKANSD